MPLRVGSDLPSVLSGLAGVYSPIKNRNARMSVKEDGEWTLKGRYSNALRLREGLPWTQDEDGKWSVTLRAEGASSEPVPSEGTGLLLPAAPVGNTSSEITPTQAQVMSVLNIQESLTVRGRVNDLRLAYSKYRGILKARDDMHRMRADGTWTLGQVSMDLLIEIFVSKSVWYGYYKKYFPRAARYPDLVKWLENDEGVKSSFDIWRMEKASYTFQDLGELLEWLDVRFAQKKEKRKVRDGEDRASLSKKQKRMKSNEDGDISM
jgi:hypothetical protein